MALKNLNDLDLNELKKLMAELGQPAFRAGQLFKWLSLGADYSEMTDLPKAFREQLQSGYTARGAEIIQRLESRDGSVKMLFRLCDGNVIEGVYMPHSYGDSLCVSTQVGCRMGCAFCASTLGGLTRSLTAGEMLAQVTQANRAAGGDRQTRKISSVVLMGSGEPLDNYDAVTKFIRLVTDENGFNLSQRSISLSTCGLCEGIYRLADEGYSVTLSLSLHATTDEARSALMPIARKYPLSEVLKAVRYYSQRTGRRVIFEYALVKDKNMNFFDAKRLAEICKGLTCHINLIMLNPVKERSVSGCTVPEAQRFLKKLVDLGLSATVRRSLGSDVGGACGQLRQSFLEDENG